MADYKNLKDWNDGEKLTGIDYTYERDAITDTVEEVEKEYRRKSQDVFILTVERPEQELEYDGLVWLNPNDLLKEDIEEQFKINVSNVNANKSLEIKTPLEEILKIQVNRYSYKTTTSSSGEIEQTLRLHIDKDSFKVLANQISLNEELKVNVLPESFKVILIFETLIEELKLDITPSSFKQQIEKENPVEELKLNVDENSFKVEIVPETLTEELKLQISPDSFKIQISSQIFEEEVKLDVTLQSFKHSMFHEVVPDVLKLDVQSSSYKQEISKKVLQDIFKLNVVNLDSFKLQNENENLEDIFKLNVDENSFKTEIKTRSLSDILKLNVSNRISFKLINEEKSFSEVLKLHIDRTSFRLTIKQEPIPDETLKLDVGIVANKRVVKKQTVPAEVLKLDVSVTASKSHTIEAKSDVEFTTNFNFGTGSTPQSVTPATSYQIIGYMDDNNVLYVSVPQTIISGNNEYLYNQTVYTVGDTSYTNTNLDFNFTVTGFVQLDFQYDLIPQIAVEAKVVDGTNGYLIEPSGFSFTSLRSTNVIMEQNLNQTLTPQFLEKHTHPLVPSSRLTITGPSTFTAPGPDGNYTNYDISSITIQEEQTSGFLTDISGPNNTITYYLPGTITSPIYCIFQYTVDPKIFVEVQGPSYQEPLDYYTNSSCSVYNQNPGDVTVWLNQNYNPEEYPTDRIIRVRVVNNFLQTCAYRYYKVYD